MSLSNLALAMGRRLSLVRLRAAGRVGADVAERALPAGEVRRPGAELAAADERAHVADGLLGRRRLLRRGPLAAGEAGLEEAKLDAIRQSSLAPQVGQRVHVELEAVLRALVGVGGGGDDPGLEVEDGDRSALFDHEVIPSLHLRAIDEEGEVLLDA